jgi:hypothetical protein
MKQETASKASGTFGSTKATSSQNPDLPNYQTTLSLSRRPQSFFCRRSRVLPKMGAVEPATINALHLVRMQPLNPAFIERQKVWFDMLADSSKSGTPHHLIGSGRRPPHPFMGWRSRNANLLWIDRQLP